MRHWLAWGAAFLAMAVAMLAAAADDRPVRKISGPIDNDAVWEGRVLVEQTVAVRAGVRLTIRPGAEILFVKGTGLEVSGILSAVGTSDRPIRFGSAEPAPARGDWKGLLLAGPGDNSVLHRAVVTDAETVQVHGGAPEISECTIRRMITGVFIGKDMSGNISKNTITDMSTHGIDCQIGSTPSIVGNTIRKCDKSGIIAQRNSAPVISGNAIGECNSGISFGSPAPAPEGNRIDNCTVGIALNNVGNGMAVRGNHLFRNATGLWIENFSSPKIEGNVFDNNGAGIFCFRSSSPDIVQNRLVGNQNGIACSQMSAPRIASNDFSRNETGVYLTLSSYARINGNNFDKNDIQVKLDNMSHDWEVRVGRKPGRGAFARSRTQAGQGKGMVAGTKATQEENDVPVGEGTIEATGNWWGEKDTAEMAAKGPAANIGSLVDGYDVPTRTYEGYPGEYLQDRINYKDWKTSRIPGTGVPDAQREDRAK
ncbi:MAG TPA: right-handed parallel beta-helix repeat-containing protein [Candidatus Deferrimicrobiaceae bacterium]|jgi:parallel beta-helix repeat protein